MGMYSDINEGISETVEIMGYPFYAEEITADESYNRREYNRKQLLNGTEVVTRGKYISRKFTFSSDIFFDDNKPNQYDDIFAKMMSKPVQVISKYMGGKFSAEVVIQKQYETATPNHMKITVDVTEIPTSKSRIPGENALVVPSPKKVKVQKSSSKSSKTSSKSSSKSSSKVSSTSSKTSGMSEAVRIARAKLEGR